MIPSKNKIFMNNEYLIAMRPMLYLMKIICALPFRLNPQYEIPHFISSKIVSFVTIVACILCHSEFGGYVLRIFFSHELENAIVFFAILPRIVIELFCLSVPLLMLNRNKQIQGYWDAWRLFQSKYESISGTPFISKKRRFIKILSLICISWISVRNFYVAWFYYHKYSNFLDYTATFYLVFSIFTILIYWFANCAYIWSASEDVMLLGKKIIAEKKANQINQLISLWLNLCDLTNHFNEAHSFLFLSIYLHAAVSIISYAHALLNYSTYKKLFPLMGWIYLSMLYISILVIMCETAHSVHRQMNDRQKEALLQGNIMEMEAMTIKSVSRFLHAICIRKPSVNLNGFFSLNRMTLPVIFSLNINYLIVLRQFSDGATLQAELDEDTNK